MSPDVELDAPAILASLLILFILVGSAVLWYRSKAATSPADEAAEPLPEWAIGWINFGIFICVLITAIVFTQQIIVSLIGDQIKEAAGKLTLLLAVAGIIAIQLPMLLTFYLLRRLYPAHYSGALNSASMSLGTALKTGSLLFIKYLPLVWLGSMVWGQLLTSLQERGMIEDLPQQEVISLLAEGGAVLPISILALGAIVLAPIVEELIFRGAIYRFLKGQMSISLAQIISGAVFALIHYNLLSFVPLVIVGVILAKVYEKTGNILIPICFHACFNGFNLLLLLLFSQSSVAGS